MMYTHDGLTLLYDTPGAPAPLGDRVTSSDLSFDVILKPPNPSNAVTVRYRVNGGLIQSLRAIAAESDYRQETQRFRATFPKLALGQSVDYAVSGTCAGRQVPDPALARDLPHSFRVAGSDRASSSRAEQRLEVSPSIPGRPRHQLAGEFLARLTFTIEPPRVVGPTPEGILVTWNAASGSVAGPRLSAKVLQAADWMQIRIDGVACVDVRSLLETPEGVRIMLTYSGIAELGKDGYQNFLNRNWPKTLRVWTTPRFLVADPSYEWLNRLACVSIGEVFVDDLACTYDVFALK